MALDDRQVEALLRRCARQRRLVQALRWLARWARLCAPGLLFGLGWLACARVLHWPLVPLAWGLATWLLVSAGVALRGAAALAPPAWQLPALIDRVSGAHGALLARQAGLSGVYPVPEAALRVRLRPRWPARELLGALLVLLGYAVCARLPLPAARVAPVAPGAALALERPRELVKRLPASDAQARAFQVAAQESLRVLAAQPAGLSRADFDALERIEAHSRTLIARSQAADAARRPALAKLDALLEAYADSRGAPAQAAALRAGLSQLGETLARAGLDPDALQQLARANDGAGRPGKPEDQGASPGQAGFDAAAVRALRDRIGELQRVGPGVGEGGEGVPGAAPLALSHRTQEPAHTGFEPNTFAAHGDRETVLLTTLPARQSELQRPAAPAVPARALSAERDVELWQEHRSPRLRALLERYFDGADTP